MITLREIRTTVCDWIEDDSDLELIDRTINTQLRYLTKTSQFEALVATKNITPDANGVIVAPPACQAITNIYPAIDSFADIPDFEFFPRMGRVSNTEVRTVRSTYTPTTSTMSSEYTGLSLTGAVGDEVFADAAGTQATVAEMVGKELRVAGDPTRYIITAVDPAVSLSVYPPVRVAATVAVSASVTPSGTKQYVLLDRDGSIYTQDVTVDYKTYHAPLINDDDDLMIPMERTLTLYTVQQFLQQSKYDVDAERLTNAIFEAQHVEFGEEPTSVQESAPQNTMFAMHSRRGGRSVTRRR